MKTYDPNLYTLVLAGIPIPTKGYADGEFIKVERDEDAFTAVVGTDGDVVRAKNHNKMAKVSFTVMQTADINAILATLALIDENSDTGAGVGPFLMKDRGGSTVYAAPESWIEKAPEPTLDKTVTSRTWIIRIAKLNGFDGAT